MELPKILGPKDVRVENVSFGVNFADLYTLKGLFEHSTPHVMGMESAGKVTEVGTDVKDIKIGDRVVCYRWTGGLFSEFIQINASNCFVLPPEMSWNDAVALPATYLTAYIIIFKIAKLQPGESILIHSCAGGVGWAATQLAKLIDNVEIFGTTSKCKEGDVKENGVQHTMAYDTYFSRMIENNKKIDCIIDSIGGDNISTSQRLLKPLGKVIMTGCSGLINGPGKFTDLDRKALNNNTAVDMLQQMLGSHGVYGFHLGLLMEQNPELIRDSMKALFQLHKDEKIRPRISTLRPLHLVADAIETLEKRRNVGKEVLFIQ